MRCTSIKENKCNAGINQELTCHQVRFIEHLLHVHVVHSGLLNWVVLNCISILRAVVGVVPHLLALKALNSADIPNMLMVVVAAITSIVVVVSSPMRVVLVPSMTMSITTMTMMTIATTVVMSIATMIVAKVSVPIMKCASLLVTSRVVTSTVLPLAVLRLLLLSFQDSGFIHQGLEIGRAHV